DGIGHVLAGARAGLFIAEEVKTTDDDSLGLTAVQPHQRAYLNVVARGGLAILTVVLRRAGTVHCFLWPAIAGLVSLQPALLAESRVSIETYLREFVFEAGR